MSGGEQQMLAIARALMGRPKLLLLDEPSLGLAPLIVKQIFEVIKELNSNHGLPVFIVEQNAYHSLKLAHRGYVMVNGRITLSGSGSELLNSEEVRPPISTAAGARRREGPPIDLFVRRRALGFSRADLHLGRRRGFPCRARARG